MHTAIASRRLKFHGVLLFLIGLLTGLGIPAMLNPRMGVSAHLEGVMNGTFLIVLGIIWPELRLGARAARWAFWLTLYAAYANWLSTTLSAAWGTGKLTPIAAGGRLGQPWQEAIVAAGLLSLTFAIITALVLLLVGLRGKPEEGTR